MNVDLNRFSMNVASVRLPVTVERIRASERPGYVLSPRCRARALVCASSLAQKKDIFVVRARRHRCRARDVATRRSSLAARPPRAFVRARRLSRVASRAPSHVPSRFGFSSPDVYDDRVRSSFARARVDVGVDRRASFAVLVARARAPLECEPSHTDEHTRTSNAIVVFERDRRPRAREFANENYLSSSSFVIARTFAVARFRVS